MLVYMQEHKLYEAIFGPDIEGQRSYHKHSNRPKPVDLESVLDALVDYCVCDRIADFQYGA